jgi:hypothetical protein
MRLVNLFIQERVEVDCPRKVNNQEDLHFSSNSETAALEMHLGHLDGAFKGIPAHFKHEISVHHDLGRRAHT